MTPKPNIPLLRKAVEWVEEQAALPFEEKQWDQTDYVNVGGRFVRNLNTRPNDWMSRSEALTSWARSATVEELSCGTTYCVAGYIGQMLEPGYRTADVYNGEHVATYARKALGLTDDQASDLFAGSNSAYKVRRLAEKYAGEQL